jgi:hypothetical protein
MHLQGKSQASLPASCGPRPDVNAFYAVASNRCRMARPSVDASWLGGVTNYNTTVRHGMIGFAIKSLAIR